MDRPERCSGEAGRMCRILSPALVADRAARNILQRNCNGRPYFRKDLL